VDPIIRILRNHVVPQGLVELAAAPAIAERKGDGALGLVLPYYVFVQFLDNLPGRLLVNLQRNILLVLQSEELRVESEDITYSRRYLHSSLSILHSLISPIPQP
jgi:hypothetical protein